jgi:cytidine deaminase
MIFKRINDLNNAQRKLLGEAERAMERAYNPYSKFYVGAALLAKDGAMLPGANYENASYGISICAERSAIVGANERGVRQFKAIAVITRGRDFDVAEPSAPCGACRQMLYEVSQLSNTDLEVIMSNTKKDKIVIAKISKLLPMAFGPLDLGMSLKKYTK